MLLVDFEASTIFVKALNSPSRESTARAGERVLDRLVGLSMLIAATSVFVYYTVWTLFMVRTPFHLDIRPLLLCSIERDLKFPYLTILQPFVDDDHILQSFFLPRVWAIRIPVILIVLATTVVGSFLSTVMIRSNRKKALKAQQKKAS
ncbi:Dolichol phosphate-mannose biosynthesis regulatory protein [Paraconiothyrium brasiliense]|uniref:Dolichol phosphate-mannose biosynthesis regulatory protein n=1 Tax=Paraconiothyrium brasiliense TaxID=300254 RepID=A0ABR3S5T3_9PLEO